MSKLALVRDRGSHLYNELFSTNLEDAKLEALEIMYHESSHGEYWHDELDFQIIEVAGSVSYNTCNFDHWYDERRKKDNEDQIQRHEEREKQEYARLKKKFGG